MRSLKIPLTNPNTILSVQGRASLDARQPEFVGGLGPWVLGLGSWVLGLPTGRFEEVIRGRLSELFRGCGIDKGGIERGARDHCSLLHNPLSMASQPDARRLAKVLYDAAKRGDTDQVTLALDQGADIDWHNPSVYNYTPLHIAANKGHEAIVRLLLDRGACINALANDSSTPLHDAARKGHDSIVRLLLDRGADITIESVPPCP